MNKSIKIIGTGVVAAIAAFLALLLSGLGTTGMTDLAGNWISVTTVKLGANEFGLLVILIVLVATVVTGFAFNTLDKN